MRILKLHYCYSSLKVSFKFPKVLTILSFLSLVFPSFQAINDKRANNSCWFDSNKKKNWFYILFGYVYSWFMLFYEYPIVGTTLFKADMTSFKLFPELVNTNITWFLSPPGS